MAYPFVGEFAGVPRLSAPRPACYNAAGHSFNNNEKWEYLQ
jgi:hypothetical protein